MDWIGVQIGIFSQEVYKLNYLIITYEFITAKKADAWASLNPNKDAHYHLYFLDEELMAN